MHEIELTGDILAAQERLAEEVRAKLTQHGVRAFNIMGAIGSGKTLLIERIIERLKERLKFGAIAGDVAGQDDYERFLRLGIPAVNELLIHTQPAHLQKLYNSELEVRERNEARATFLRRRLAERRGEQN